MERCIYLGFKAIEKRPRSLKRRELEMCSWTQKNSKPFLTWEFPLLRARGCLRRIICNSVSGSCRRDILLFYHCAVTHKMLKHSSGTSTEAYSTQLNVPGLFWSVQKAARNHHPVPRSHCPSGTEGKRRTPSCLYLPLPSYQPQGGWVFPQDRSQCSCHAWPQNGLVGPCTHTWELLNWIIKLPQRRLASSPRFLRLRWGAGLHTGSRRCHHLCHQLVPAGQEPPGWGCWPLDTSPLCRAATMGENRPACSKATALGLGPHCSKIFTAAAVNNVFI